MKTAPIFNAERNRLEAQRVGRENWRLWGPYLAERAWGTVREDYSPHGNAWEHFDHDQARSRAYRWNEDGMGGICDEGQHLCFALALWNGRDPILKERAFGLTGNQGNHGEDVKEYYFYLDATPTQSYLRYLYKYPQAAYPYAQLVEENARRSRHEPPFSLLDTGVFDDGRYWDVEVSYAKAAPEEIHIRIIATNRGPDTATLHLLPTLWFRNTWSWGESGAKPALAHAAPPQGAQWAVQAEHPALGTYFLYGRHAATPLYTENETNAEQLWGVRNAAPFVKDAFHRRVVHGEAGAVNPELHGTKFAAWHEATAQPGETVTVELVLCARALAAPFDKLDVVFARAESEACAFYEDLLPEADTEDFNILRQALAGMIWSKQFFHYDVARWLDGDALPPPDGHRHGRNRSWRHMKSAHVISMPDTWEYPWFAAWDLAFHCATLALVDVDFAKEQIELLLKENFLHPNGQIPAYEWAFGDVNPPVLAMAALKVFRAERVQRGAADIGFLQRVTHKLLMNYTWWLNRKDADGANVFEGGFLGLDNISVYDRSQPLPPGYSLKQADATGWMAMFALNMTVMCLELAAADSDYEDVAIQCYTQFLGIANTIAGGSGMGVSLWDEDDGFFKDVVVGPDGSAQRIDVFSFVGLIPLFAAEIVDERLLAASPRFHAVMNAHRYGLFDGMYVSECPTKTNARGEHLLALVDADKLQAHPAARAERGRIPVGVRRAQRLAHPRTAPGPGPRARHRPGIDRVRAGRIEQRALRRQLQLARADLDADQLHAGADDREVPPLPGRRLQGHRSVSGRHRDDLERRREAAFRPAREHLPPRSGRAHSRTARSEPVPKRPGMARPAAFQRVLPCRERPRPRRDAPDRLDRARREPRPAALSRRDTRLLAAANTGGGEGGSVMSEAATEKRVKPFRRARVTGLPP